MAFSDGEFQETIDSPGDLCPDKLGGLLAAFPSVPLPTHERSGVRFTPPPCGQALALDPDFCITTVKMDPQTWRPERDAIVGAIQSAVNCSHGVTDDDLRREAKAAIDQNLSRAIESDLVDALIAEAGAVLGTGLEATCALSEAAMFLASQGACPTGVIIGPVDWFTALTKDSLVWDGARKIHTDVSGNIVLSHSVDNATIFAFDSNVIIKTSEILLLDDFMPGQRERNDRIVRAEQLYLVALAPCAVGSWTFACCPCSGGGGGGGGNVTVTNFPPFPANQNVTVTNFPPFPANQNVTVTNPVTIGGPVTIANPTFSNNVDDECLQDNNGIFFRRAIDDGQGVITVSTVTITGAPYVPVGPITACDKTQVIRDTEVIELCDLGTTPATPVLVATTFDELGNIFAVNLYDYNGLPYNPVGIIGQCSDCCPVVLGEGCATGSRKWTSLRESDGTITLYNQVDGTVVAPVDVVSCTTAVVINSQHRLVVPGSPWTPGGDVVGTLTSVTFTVVTGTATVLDSNGTSAAGLPTGLSASWDSEDENTLIGPTSIASVGGTVYVQWTQR